MSDAATVMGKAFIMKEGLRKFILDNYLFGGLLDFSDEDSLVGKGIIDSTGILKLVSFLELTYGIEVTDDELAPENLDSINELMRYLSCKHGGYGTYPYAITM